MLLGKRKAKSQACVGLGCGRCIKLQCAKCWYADNYMFALLGMGGWGALISTHQPLVNLLKHAEAVNFVNNNNDDDDLI